MTESRKILHCDMDSFYASIEQRDHPAYRGKPVIVGGDPDKRGVVATASYEARVFGVHSAQAAKTAQRLCPHAIFLRPRFEVYRAVSVEIMEIFREYTPLIEPLSLDEAYLDVTQNLKGIASATLLARELKQRVFAQTGLTISIGVSYCKFVAKIASDTHKPDGLTVVRPEQAELFLAALPVTKFFGVGKVTAAKLEAQGIHTGADLRLLVETRLQEVQVSAKTITLKVKFADFAQITRAITLSKPLQDAQAMMPVLRSLLAQLEGNPKLVRLLGVTVSGLVDQNETTQPPALQTLSLWE